jgi:hypothetical protein
LVPEWEYMPNMEIQGYLSPPNIYWTIKNRT